MCDFIGLGAVWPGSDIFFSDRGCAAWCVYTFHYRFVVCCQGVMVACRGRMVRQDRGREWFPVCS
jgi:hypothetical protein